MTIVECINRITDWTQEVICPQVQLKVPDDNCMDEGYEHRLVQPTAFPLYMPGEDNLPPKIVAPIPCVCTQLMEGESNLLKNAGQLKLRYVFAAWNPGRHGPDNLGTAGTVGYTYIPPGESAPRTPPAHLPVQVSETFQQNAEGWQDVWNFVDVSIRELESTNLIQGLRVVREEPIRFGPISEQGALVDFYPYWYAWVSFAIEYGVVRNNPANQEFL